MFIFDHIKSSSFFPMFCPGVTNWKAKMRGKTTRGKSLEFSKQDQIQIVAGIQQMSKIFTKDIMDKGTEALTPMSFGE